MKLFRASAGALVLSGVLIVGCHKGSETTTSPTTIPVPEGNMKMMGPTTMAVPIMPPAKDMTHELTMDEPFFTTEPGPSATPVGTLKAGSKVLVLVPGATYSQVMTDTGVSAYTLTDGLKPLGK